MAIIIRKNNGLNNALAGMERGLNNGMQLGLEASRTRAAQEEAAKRTQLAREQAMRIDQEMQREAAERAAAQEAAGMMADEFGRASPGEGLELQDPANGEPGGIVKWGSDQPASPLAKMGPAVTVPRPTRGAPSPRPAGPSGPKWDRIKEIAKRMDPAAARVFIQDARDREIEAKQETHRGELQQRISEMLRQGAGKTDPELAEWMSPEDIANGDAEYESALEKLSAIASDPKSNPALIEAELAGLQKNRIKSEGAALGRMSYFQQITEQAQNANATKPFSPQQGMKVRTLMAAYRQDPSIAASPQRMEQFRKEWDLAIRGKTMVGGQEWSIDDAEKAQTLTMALRQSQVEANKALATQREMPRVSRAAGNPLKNMELALKYDEAANEIGVPKDEADRLRAFARQLRGESVAPGAVGAEGASLEDAIQAGPPGEETGSTLNIPEGVDPDAYQDALDRLLETQDPEERARLLEELSAGLAGG